MRDVMVTDYRFILAFILGLLAVEMFPGAIAETAKENGHAGAKQKTNVLRAAISETMSEADLSRLGLICSTQNHWLVIRDIAEDGAASASGLAVGDVIARIDRMQETDDASGRVHDVFKITANRNGKTFQVSLAIDVFQSNSTPEFERNSFQSSQPKPNNSQIARPAKPAAASTNANYHAPPLPSNWRKGNLAATFANLWIARYHHPENKELREQLDNVEDALSKKVSANGGQWHIVEYYGPERWQNGVADPQYLLNGGVRLYGIGDLIDARRLFEETLRVDANNADAYFNLGALCECAGNQKQAREFYLKAQELHHDTGVNRTNLNAGIAAGTVGKMPVLYAGGLKENATKRIELLRNRLQASGTIYTKEGTCSLCRIVRGAILTGN